ncbi:MAG: transfer protein Tra, partial [Propionibacteriaceae bacterium]|nr:transfer protein Tra [Propionibacteriaceae bacterium]
TASLALRQGRPTALGFYLDRQRIHVGDATTTLDQAFDGWMTDRARGLDSLMLAPTHDLVAQLNARARAQRLGERLPGPEVSLADGNRVSAGDTIVTRRNERRLTYSRHGWVRNGDRWTVLAVNRDQSLTVANASGWQVKLPAGYVRDDVVLGYASTIHGAQGLTVDSMHGVLSGQESRQQLYTMMTRGRQTNHVWLEVVGDGDDATLIRPEGVHPLTPTDMLAKILGRDGSQTSANTLLRDQHDARLLLGDATQRYLDGLQFAAERHLGVESVATLDAQCEQLLPGISDAPAWPTLRSHLLLLGAQGVDPFTKLTEAFNLRDIAGAHDIAAVMSWRLDDSGLRNAARGPLPWIPGIPEALTTDPQFGPWLQQRADLVTQLASAVRDAALTATVDPGWVPAGVRRPSIEAIADVEVWRAAMQIEPADLRPTGPMQLSRAALDWQRELNQQIRQGVAPALAEWGESLNQISPAMVTDEYLPRLADQLAGLARTGHNAAAILAEAAAFGPVPDDHAAAAIWWRIQRLTPNTDAGADPVNWSAQLPELVGETIAQQFTASPYWPALVQQVDEAIERGW